MFPYGNGGGNGARNASNNRRSYSKHPKSLGVTQRDLALTSGTGLRFIVELEKGKETCEIDKALLVLHTLGIEMTLSPPPARRLGAE